MSQKGSFVKAICNELRLRKNYLNHEIINTIYFGGGTPSQLDETDFKNIFQEIDNNFTVSKTAEITIECNPDDLDEAYILMLKKLPFNRISLGVQSLNEDDLKFLQRRHSARKAKEAIELCQNLGFTNISIDLIYGLPQQTMDTWSKTIDEAIKLKVQHISAYHLTYEENTKLSELLHQGKINQINEDTSVEMFLTLIDRLTESGFIHYEISNFALPDCYSRHNSSYWSGKKYLGIGPSAHSYNGESRSWNTSSLNQYIYDINNNKIQVETEHLSQATKYNDYILTGLRTMWGINLNKLQTQFGEKLYNYCLHNATRYIADNYIKRKDENLILSKKGLLISDRIMSDLMYIE